MKRFESNGPEGAGEYFQVVAPAARARASDTGGGGAGGGLSDALAISPQTTPATDPPARLERKWRSTAYLTIGIPPRAPWG
jgi:hypothetical protein